MIADTEPQDLLEYAATRRQTGDLDLDRVLERVIASSREVEQRNRALEAANLGLLTALEDARNKVATFERSGATADSALTRMALGAAAQMIEQAKQATERLKVSAKAQNADRYEAAAGRAAELNREAATVLEAARAEAAQRNEDATAKGLEFFEQVHHSLVAMSKELDVPTNEETSSAPVPLAVLRPIQAEREEVAGNAQVRRSSGGNLNAGDALQLQEIADRLSALLRQKESSSTAGEIHYESRSGATKIEQAPRAEVARNRDLNPVDHRQSDRIRFSRTSPKTLC